MFDEICLCEVSVVLSAECAVADVRGGSCGDCCCVL